MGIPKIVLLVCWVWGCLILGSCTSQYKVASVRENSTSMELDLQYFGKDEYYIKQTSPIVKNLLFTFHVCDYLNFNVKIVDKNNKRFEVPQSGIFPVDPCANFSYPIALASIRFNYTKDPFDFTIIRKSTNATIFSTLGG